MLISVRPLKKRTNWTKHNNPQLSDPHPLFQSLVGSVLDAANVRMACVERLLQKESGDAVLALNLIEWSLTRQPSEDESLKNALLSFVARQPVLEQRAWHCLSLMGVQKPSDEAKSRPSTSASAARQERILKVRFLSSSSFSCCCFGSSVNRFIFVAVQSKAKGVPHGFRC